MATTERNTKEKQTADLLSMVGTRYSQEIATSVVGRFNDLRHMSNWELEEMMDDLISKMNDRE